jgi:hypothetical protein
MPLCFRGIFIGFGYKPIAFIKQRCFRSFGSSVQRYLYIEHAALVFSKAQSRYFVEWSVATEDPLKNQLPVPQNAFCFVYWGNSFACALYFLSPISFLPHV